MDLKTRKTLNSVDNLLVILGSNDPIESLDGVERKILSYSQHPEYEGAMAKFRKFKTTF